MENVLICHNCPTNISIMNIFNVFFFKPIGINTQLMYLSTNEKPNVSQLYSFIFHYLEENKGNANCGVSPRLKI